MRREEFYRQARAGSVGPLEGVRVVGLTKVWSGPLATCVLADLGADVVDVELPGGRDGQVPPDIPGTSLSWFRETVHRNKRSITMDLREPAGRDRLLALVATADLVVENYKPGTLDRWGVGYEDCRSVRPDIVFVSISGWGQYRRGTACRRVHDGHPAVQQQRAAHACGDGSTVAPARQRDGLRRAMQRLRMSGRAPVPRGGAGQALAGVG